LSRPGVLKPADQYMQDRFQRRRVHPIGRHHSESQRIVQKLAQSQLVVIHRVPFRTGVEIGSHTR
jgi:hypothetical protein